MKISKNIEYNISIFFSALFFAGLFYYIFFYESPEDKEIMLQRERKREIEELNRIRVENSVNEMITVYNPFVEWDSILVKGESYRFNPIYSIELEQQWINRGNPILFKGIIIDVKTKDDNNFEILIERDILSSLDYLFRTNLRLSLTVSKEILNDCFDKNQFSFQESPHPIHNHVVVIAKITDIRGDELINEEGQKIQIKIGVGDLIDLIFIGDI